MKKEIVKRLTPADVASISTQIHDCLSALCAKAHPHTFHECDADCPFMRVCVRLDNALKALDEVYYNVQQ